MIYTSYYAGEIKREAVSISLYPPKSWTGKHLPLFAPTPELLCWWKSSAKDTAAQQEYKRQLGEILDSRLTLIQLWVAKQKDNPVDITLCCFEKTGDFCHRYQVGSEVVQKYLPELWGGEIGTNRTPLRVTQGGKMNLTCPPKVLNLIEQCHSSGFPVQCDRLACGYYRVSLHEENLGEWSELGVLSVLSGLRHEFYRERLLPSLATAAIPPIAPVPQPIASQPQSASLITRLAKLEGEELAQIQDWCKSIKNQMFPSVSQYADDRLELHLRRFVSLTGAKSGKKAEVKLIEPGRYAGADVIEALGEKLLPDFHQALVLFYPAGTQIKVHRDSPAYASGAAQINIMGRAKFSISGCQNVRQMESYWLEKGDCIAFDNKQPHGIDRVVGDRWCVCFFRLKAEYGRQLSLV
jgi:alkylated DNA repair dioxygenase AlkB